MYLHVHRFTSGLKRKVARIMPVTGQEAHERVGEECAPNPFLRFVDARKIPPPYHLLKSDNAMVQIPCEV